MARTPSQFVVYANSKEEALAIMVACPAGKITRSGKTPKIGRGPNKGYLPSTSGGMPFRAYCTKPRAKHAKK
jgi:hypothetical protein